MNVEPVVVVDDERTHPCGDVHLRSSRAALTWLAEAGCCRELWLDHDLGGDDTTRPVALWLVERAYSGAPFDVDTIYVHSMNPVGVDWLVATLGRHYRVLRRRWF